MFAELVEISPMSAGKPKFRAFYVVAFITRNYIGGLLNILVGCLNLTFRVI